MDGITPTVSYPGPSRRRPVPMIHLIAPPRLPSSLASLAPRIRERVRRLSLWRERDRAAHGGHEATHGGHRTAGRHGGGRHGGPSIRAVGRHAAGVRRATPQDVAGRGGGVGG